MDKHVQLAVFKCNWSFKLCILSWNSKHGISQIYCLGVMHLNREDWIIFWSNWEQTPFYLQPRSQLCQWLRKKLAVGGRVQQGGHPSQDSISQ